MKPKLTAAQKQKADTEKRKVIRKEDLVLVTVNGREKCGIVTNIKKRRYHVLLLPKRSVSVYKQEALARLDLKNPDHYKIARSYGFKSKK